MARGAHGRNAIAAQVAALRNLNQQAAAALLGVPVRSLRDWNAPRNEKTRTYDGPELVRWFLERERSKRKSMLMDDEGGALTPAKERLIEERLRAEKRKNDVAEGLVMARDQIVDDFRKGALILNQRLDAVGRAYGPEVAKAIGAALDEVERTWSASLEAIDPPAAPDGKAAG